MLVPIDIKLPQEIQEDGPKIPNQPIDLLFSSLLFVVLTMLRNYTTEDNDNYLTTQPQYQPSNFTIEYVPQGVGNDDIILVDNQTLQKADRDRRTIVVVYRCQWDLHDRPCGMWVEGGLKEIRTHLRNYHDVSNRGNDSITCYWLGCFNERKPDSMSRHVMTHLGVRSACTNCGQTFARGDCARAHLRTGGGCATANIVDIPGPQARIVGQECSTY
ncbi:hypothetical protein BS17DRAFT_335335 [Gyrodon lividus]|nr:hypothetical protein BS17DRAFT_335335 [Gyrodon lividus]